MRKLSSATTLSGTLPWNNIWYFFSILLCIRKSKISENKTNEKLLFTIDPEKSKNRTEMTLASENLWATEREKNFLFWRFIECWWENVLKESERRERTDSLLWEDRREFEFSEGIFTFSFEHKIFPAFFFFFDVREKLWWEKKNVAKCSI